MPIPYGTQPFLSTTEMTNRVMFGIPLNDAEGKPFPQDLLQSYLDSAVAWIEQTLGIAIVQRNINDEYHDFVASDFMNWTYIKLWRKPILAVNSLELWFGPQRLYSIPKEWMRVDKLAGTVQLFPYAGSAGDMILTASGGMYVPMLFGGVGYAPQMWKVDYDVGMMESATPGVYRQTDIHPNLKEIIYKRAAIGVLGVWGDLIIGAGIAAMSTSIDGIMQSVDSTQSAEYGGASARISQLEKDIKLLLPTLRSYYDGINMVVI